MIPWFKTKHMSILPQTRLDTGNSKATRFSRSSTNRSMVQTDARSKKKPATLLETRLHLTRYAKRPTISVWVNLSYVSLFWGIMKTNIDRSRMCSSPLWVIATPTICVKIRLLFSHQSFMSISSGWIPSSSELERRPLTASVQMHPSSSLFVQAMSVPCSQTWNYLCTYILTNRMRGPGCLSLENWPTLVWSFWSG